MRKSDIESIQTCPLFNNLDRERISALLKELSPSAVSYEKNEVIFSPVSFTRSLAVITKGSAAVTKTGGSSTVYMSKLISGNIFGMASLFYESDEYLTCITAKEKCRVMFLTREQVDLLFRLEPITGVNYITILSERIHFLNKRISEIACPDAREKLLQYLTVSCERDENGSITLPCSASSLASALSIGRTSLYRAFDALEAEGTIVKNGKNIILR